MKYIINGRIVLPDRMIYDSALVYDGQIRGTVSSGDVPRGAEIIDAHGALVCPGFVDIHIHGYGGADASDGDPEGLRLMAEGVASHGVTSFLPTTMSVSYGELRRAFDAVRSVISESADWNGAQILGVHAEGPFINPLKKGAQNGDNIKKPDASFVIENADVIRSITVAPELDAGHRFIKRISGYGGISVSMGHTVAGFEEARTAVKDGVSRATHLFNAMSALGHREPGAVGAALCTDVYTELICDTYHVDPGLFRLTAEIKRDKLVLITDSIRACGMPDGKYDLGGLDVELRGRECRLADGTLAGSVLTMDMAVKNLMEYAGLSIPAAVSAASANPARAIGEERKGALLEGRDADIVIADDCMNVIFTVRGGRVIYKA